MFKLARKLWCNHVNQIKKLLFDKKKYVYRETIQNTLHFSALSHVEKLLNFAPKLKLV